MKTRGRSGIFQGVFWGDIPERKNRDCGREFFREIPESFSGGLKRGCCWDFRKKREKKKEFNPGLVRGIRERCSCWNSREGNSGCWEFGWHFRREKEGKKRNSARAIAEKYRLILGGETFGH